MALIATLCGAQTCVDIATFARAKLPLLRRFLRLAHGAPSHDTFSRVFQALDPEAFEDAFHRFMAALAHAQDGARTAEPASPRIIALDGKSVRRAVEAAHPTTPLHLVTAWATEQRLVLAQCHARNRSEVSATQAILALLDLRAAPVSRPTLCTGAALPPPSWRVQVTTR